jgi:cytochrome b involved in lipid metabolism
MESPAGGGLSAAEVAKHASPDDCWLIINQKVYDVSEYLTSHPGGTAVVTPYCGKEATSAFEAIKHSQLAIIHLESLYVGDLAP